MKILNRFTEKVILKIDRANLCGANLRGANLRGANLCEANLYKANLCEADLCEAYLCEAYLYKANLCEADLRGANLRGANLRGANLRGANLCGAKNITFHKFPSITTISSINLGKLSNSLSLELMRRNTEAHPYPERFDEWAKGGDCPYQNEEYFFKFHQDRSIWKSGKPTMNTVDLIRAICKEKEWIIK